MKQLAWAAAVVIASVATPSAWAREPASKPAATQVKPLEGTKPFIVASYNINWGNPNLPQVELAVRRSGADLICFQEYQCRVLPVRDRRHQVNVFHYILKHRNQGAWTWDYRQPPPSPSPHFSH